MSNPTAKILFIAEDQSVLQSLQKLLHGEKWSCHFVASAKEALEYLQTQLVDLVVSDINMTDMDSIELITAIRQRYPSIVRMFLTSHAKQDKTLAALASGYVQQIVPIPWVDQELKEIIRSALRQSAQQQKHNITFQGLINSVPLLPALPKSYSTIRTCTTNGEIDIDKMVNVISHDVAISSMLLHWANSALFGQRFHVDTIKKAIIVLGTDIVENLILTESIDRSITSQLPQVNGFSLDDFKKHSMTTAILARLLIKSILPTDFIQHDRAFITGLLHDIGKLAAANFFPDQFEKAITFASLKEIQLIEAEQKVYQTDHAELGSFIAEWWALPPFIVNAIRWHHHPKSTPIDQDVITATHVANLLSYQFNRGANNDNFSRNISDEYRNKFHLTEEANEILRAETEQTIQMLTP